MKYIFFFIYTILSAGGLVLFKIGSKDFQFLLTEGTISLSINAYFILGIFSYVLSFLLYLYLVSQLNLSYIYPVSIGVINIMILIASTMVLKEPIVISQIIGSVIIILGIIISSLGVAK